MMDKPIHTLKEWPSIVDKTGTWGGQAMEILRDWGRDELILKARIAELDEENDVGMIAIQISEADLLEANTTIDRLTKQNKILDEVLGEIGGENTNIAGSGKSWVRFGEVVRSARQARQAAKELSE